MRGRRRYVVCGARTLPNAGRGSAWWPSVTLAFALVASAVFFGRPMQPPDDPQRVQPLASFAHYTVEDFFTAAR